MTPMQAEKLLTLLERIAEALEALEDTTAKDALHMESCVSFTCDDSAHRK